MSPEESDVDNAIENAETSSEATIAHALEDAELELTLEGVGEDQAEGELSGDTLPEETEGPVETEALSSFDDASGLPLSARLSAIIFSSSRPLQIEALKRLTGAPFDVIEEALAQVKGLFADETHGFSLRQVAGGYQFRTAPMASETLRKLLPAKTRRLSRAAAETLAVIAYKQPVQRAEIEAIRGVDALPTVKTLLDQKLIRLVGHDHSIGQPALYATTELFLERFGLNDLSDLPSERELLQLDSEPGEVGETETETAQPIES